MGTLNFATGGYFATMNRALIWPTGTAFNARVSGAGTAAVNGTYDYDGTKWTFGIYIIDKPTNWQLRTGATIYYTATATEFPWQAVWTISTGAAPPPVVQDFTT